jgi:ribosomal protein S18 acetylase RimI-like enzyme
MENIFIRRAEARDAGLVADLSRQTFQETFAAVNTTENMQLFLNKQFSKELLINEVTTGRGIFYLAYHNKIPAGYAYMREGTGFSQTGNLSAIELARIYAARSFQGIGIGKALMLACIETAIELNKEMIWLGVWEHNMKAIDFYKRRGFEKFGEHEFVLGKDIQVDWLMKKDLR